jgi:hypothetical protein
MRPKPNLRENSESIDQYVQNYRGEMQTNSLILAKNPQTNENKSADFSAFENGFRCVQKKSLDKCKQISQCIAHENAWFWMRPKPTLQGNVNQLTDMSKTILEKYKPIR